MIAKDGDNPILKWPEPCKCMTYEPMLLLAELPEHIKALVWSDLKKNNPMKAKCLATISRDEFVKELIREFDGSLALIKEDLSADAYEATKAYFL